MSGGRYIPRRKGNHEKYYQLTDSKEKTRIKRRTKATPNDVPGTREWPGQLPPGTDRRSNTSNVLGR